MAEYLKTTSTNDKMLIPLRTHSSDRYHFNVLIIIAIIYPIYIESGLYNLSYGEKQGWVHAMEFLEKTMGELKDNYSFTRDDIILGP